MSDFRALQESFHVDADSERFWKRLRNPFLQIRERRLARRIAQEFPSGGGCVLELGCGEGSNLLYLKECLPHPQYFGCDFSLEKVRFLKSNVSAERKIVNLVSLL